MALLSLATLQLVKILLANNKIQDIDKIYNDIQYRNKLMEEYKIYERIKKDRSHNVNGYFSEKRGLKNIYEKLCLKYTKIPEAFNIQSMNNSKEFINSSKQNRFQCCCTFDTYII